MIITISFMNPHEGVITITKDHKAIGVATVKDDNKTEYWVRVDEWTYITNAQDYLTIKEQLLEADKQEKA